jgi:hypothetical protein
VKTSLGLLKAAFSNTQSILSSVFYQLPERTPKGMTTAPGIALQTLFPFGEFDKIAEIKPPRFLRSQNGYTNLDFKLSFWTTGVARYDQAHAPMGEVRKRPHASGEKTAGADGRGEEQARRTILLDGAGFSDDLM